MRNSRKMTAFLLSFVLGLMYLVVLALPERGTVVETGIPGFPQSVFVVLRQGTNRATFYEDHFVVTVGLFNSPYLSVWAAQEVYKIHKAKVPWQPKKVISSVERCVRAVGGEYACADITAPWGTPPQQVGEIMVAAWKRSGIKTF